MKTSSLFCATAFLIVGPGCRGEADRFTEARQIATLQAYESFLAEYPGGEHAAAAKASIELRRQARLARDEMDRYFRDFATSTTQAPSGMALSGHVDSLRMFASRPAADARETELAAKANAAANLLDPFVSENMRVIGTSLVAVSDPSAREEARSAEEQYVRGWVDRRTAVSAALGDFYRTVDALGTVPPTVTP